MRTETLILQYLSTVLFVGLAVRSVRAWMRNRDRRASHLALATALFGLQSLVSAVNTTILDPFEQPPRAVSVLTSFLLYVSIYFFLRFLADFIKVPQWLLAVFGIATVVNVVLSIVEQGSFDPTKGLIDKPGANNWIPYKVYIDYVLAYLAIAFALLFVAFLVYGLRVDGLARFRMLTISAGFFLLFVVIGFLPVLLRFSPSSETFNDILRIVRYVALPAAPLLLIGFAPPKQIMARYGVEPPRPRLGSE